MWRWRHRSRKELRSWKPTKDEHSKQRRTGIGRPPNNVPSAGTRCMHEFHGSGQVPAQIVSNLPALTEKLAS